MQPVHRSTDGPSFCLCREERQSVIKTVWFLIHCFCALSGMLSAIHQITNSQWSTMHSTPTNCVTRKNDKTYGQLNPHSLSLSLTHSGVRHLPALCAPWHSQTELQGSEEHVYERKPQKKVLYSGTESRQIGSEIWTSQSFLIDTGPFIHTFIPIL